MHPLPSQEFVHQPFDDVLSYEQFSLRLRVSDMPQLMVGAPGTERGRHPAHRCGTVARLRDLDMLACRS